jgi:hypothetical protein
LTRNDTNACISRSRDCSTYNADRSNP